ncbi:hypothetical protein C2857_003717 [Epichloe festucae Fl1]|uniref:Uncharacterized protein n=1 Tax=Epichloe festucae (strain Fl1) TaxID=877507 RepID=A0A7S9PTT1_EPIFF|nr:hypothetical protein C2857_003717 [Epichloe festucae Fl1]
MFRYSNDLPREMDQHVKLYYLGESPALETEKPYLLSAGLLKSVPQCNWRYEAGPEQVIKDARGHEEEFNYVENGFAFRPWSPSPIDWENETQIREKFLVEAQEFVRRELNFGDDSLKRCEVFDWRLRISSSAAQLTNLDKGHMAKIRPAQAVHIDQSLAGAFDRLKLHYPNDDIQELTAKYRVQIINLWRPFRGTVQQWPLAVCDGRTVGLDSLDELEYVSEEFVRRSYLARWSDSYRFHYLSNMTSDEVVVFKIFDSAFHVPQGSKTPGSHVLGCPHAAFELPSVTSAPPRESVEVRMFVVSEY